MADNSKKYLESEAKQILMDLMEKHQEEIIESATDWVRKVAIDLRGKRPNEETHKFVTMGLKAYRDTFFFHDDVEIYKLVDTVIKYRGPMDFRISTIEKGFLSLIKVTWWILRKECQRADILLEADKQLDALYETALYELSDKYQGVVESALKEKIEQLKAAKEDLEKTVEKRSKELQVRIKELEEFHKLTVGREMKMIELKKEISELKKSRLDDIS